MLRPVQAPNSAAQLGASPRAPRDVVEQRFTVECAYPVVFTRGLFSPDNTALVWALARRDPTTRCRVLVVLDGGLVRAQPELLDAIAGYGRVHTAQLQWSGPPAVIPGGETAKHDPSVLAQLQRRMCDDHIDRHAYVLAIGGGAVLDVVGYAAATVHRGVRLVRAPSTALAQNDAGIGVKNGVNAFGLKNFLGTFAPPWAVIDDLDLLRSLPPRDRTAGIAEAIKVALIRDSQFFAWMQRHAASLERGDTDEIETMVRRCAELHLAHIRTGGDPFERGSARPLDFGHWAAHKLESLTSGALRHGEAVAIGIAIDTRYSVATGLLPAAAGNEVIELLRAVGLPTWDAALGQRGVDGKRAVLAGLDEFREHLGGELTITLLSAIGRGVEVHVIDGVRLAAAIDSLDPDGGQ